MVDDGTLLECPLPTPAVGFSIPDGYQKGYLGMLSMGSTLQSRTRLSGDFFDPDGNISAGLGLGDPINAVGAELRVNIYGLQDNRGAGNNFGEGTFDIHLSRMLTDDIWLGGGVYDLTGWKREEPNQLYSGYFTATKVFNLRDSGAFHKIFLTVGAGNGRFRTSDDFDVTEENGIGFIGGLTMAFSRRTNLIVEWKGYNVVSGLAFIPFKRLPAQVIIGMNDVFHEKRSLLIGGSLSFSIFHSRKDSCWKNEGWYGPPPPQPSRT